MGLVDLYKVLDIDSNIAILNKQNDLIWTGRPFDIPVEFIERLIYKVRLDDHHRYALMIYLD